MEDLDLIKIYEKIGLSDINMDAVDAYMKKLDEELRRDFKILHSSLKLLSEVRVLMHDFLDCFRTQEGVSENLKPGSPRCISVFKELKEKLKFLEMSFEGLRKDSNQENIIEGYVQKHVKHWQKVFEACEKSLKEKGFI
jgi:hypothetical protein